MGPSGKKRPTPASACFTDVINPLVNPAFFNHQLIIITKFKKEEREKGCVNTWPMAREVR